MPRWLAVRPLTDNCGWLFLISLLFCAPLHAGHPLITEDTDTQGRGNFQVELSNEQFSIQDQDTRQKQTLTNLTLTYGILENLDVLIGAPYWRLGAVESTGTPATQGMGDLGLEVKWRFYEKDQLSMAVKSGFTFPTGDDVHDLGTGRVTWSAFFVSSYALEEWAFHLHLGYLYFNNSAQDRLNLWHASAAVARKLGEDLRLVLDTGIDTNPDAGAGNNITFLIAGLVYSPRTNIDLDLGYKIMRNDSLRIDAVLAGMAYRW